MGRGVEVYRLGQVAGLTLGLGSVARDRVSSSRGEGGDRGNRLGMELPEMGSEDWTAARCCARHGCQKGTMRFGRTESGLVHG